ncbi:MAG: fumarylacetoacetase [Candidatus Eremiobacteraeota bacterium]|nr:fumarylacetoacetase [Candidatus Eremiobacteraeota bacterium]
MRAFDSTTDPALRSWLDVAPGSDFPIQNLPFGVFVHGARDVAPRLGVAIGDKILDLSAVAHAGLLDDAMPEAFAVFAAPSLNRLLARGRAPWRAVRERLSALLSAGNRELHDAGVSERAIVERAGARYLLPFEVADYVDFYSSREHATNLGKILRPDTEPLLPNWKWIPIGYHGRAGTVVISDTPIVRPNGQRKAPDATEPAFGPTRMLDFELELGFVTGNGPALGSPLGVAASRDVIFGAVIVNDWSARDIQGWEYVPLGPFLGKSFATSVSPWVVTLDALAPFRVEGPAQSPPALEYLRAAEPRNYDIALAVELVSAKMDAKSAQTISRTNARGLYWSVAQQLAHLASNGATVRAGDLCATGTISGSEPGTYGSMIELTWRGARPLQLANGEMRAFLEDGDAVTMRASCDRAGAAHIGFGSVSGRILPAP